MAEVERCNHSGWNDAKIAEEAHRLYTERTGKKFELDHWYELLKDQPKWRAICEPPKSGSGSSKRSNPDTEEAGEEGASGRERPEGRKAAKRRLKEKGHNTVHEQIQTQLTDLNITHTGVSEMFKDFLSTAKEEKLQR